MEGKDSSVYNFHDYRSFLQSAFQARKLRNRRFSLGAWAERLDLASSSTLIMILKGSRNPSGSLTDKIVKDLQLGPSEAEYFRNLVQLSKAGTNEHLRQVLLEKLVKKSPRRSFRPLSVDVFRAFSSWLPVAVRELVDLKSFREDLDWIQRRLRFKANKTEIEQAIRSLVAAGLLKRSENGTLAYEQAAETTYDIPHESIKQFHESILRLNLEAIRSLTPAEREISGLTFTMRAEDLPKLKARIRDFLREIGQVSPADHDSVYHLEVSCLPLTKEVRP